MEGGIYFSSRNYRGKDFFIKALFIVIVLFVVGFVSLYLDGKFVYYIVIAIISVSIKNYKGKKQVELNNQNPERSPSPEDPFIGSFLDKTEISSPIQELLDAQFYINGLPLLDASQRQELFVVFVLFIILLYNKIFTQFTSNKVRGLVINELEKRDISTNKADTLFNMSSHFSNKYFYIIFIILTLNFLFLIFLSFVVNYELTHNLDYYIQTHNDLFNKSIFMLNIPWISKLYSGYWNKNRIIRYFSTKKKVSKVTISRNKIRKVYDYLKDNKNIIVEDDIATLASFHPLIFTK